MVRSIVGTSLRNETVVVAAMSLALLLSSATTYAQGAPGCSVTPNTYDPADFDRVLENFEQTTTLWLEGPAWDNTLVRNCKVHDTGADGNQSAGIFIKNVRNVVIQNCEVWNTGNKGRGIKLSSWGGTEDVTIEGNYVHDTGWDGIWSGQDVIDGVDHKNLKVRLNRVENTGIGDLTQGRHPIYLQSSEFVIEGNIVTGPRDANGISIRSSGIVRCNSVSGTSRTGRPGIRYFSDHEAGLSNLLVIEQNNVVSDTIGIHLYRPANRWDGQSPPEHVVKNFIIRNNMAVGNPPILVASEYDDPIYSVEVYNNPPSAPDSTPPTVMLTSPLGGAILSGNVTVTAEALDNVAVAKVEFFIDDGPFVAFDASWPYSIALDTAAYPDGGYVIRAESIDTAGNRSSGDQVSVVFDNAGNPDTIPPQVSLVNLSDGEIVKRRERRVIKFNATDDNGVQFISLSINAQAVYTGAGSGEHSYKWKVPGKPNATYVIAVDARDPAGNQANKTITVRTRR